MPDGDKADSVYERDFCAWAGAQAAALRAARDAVAGSGVSALDALDWDNLAEEIEALAQRDRRELASLIALVVEHLTKLTYSPASSPRVGWLETIGRARGEIEDLLGASPSLRREVPQILSRVAPRALDMQCEPEQVLGDWFPDAQPIPPPARRRARRKSS
ncbi:MAG: DUF29 domain-containing protein [Acetobacteraceae bacterium]|nr:DUF29 domain-containing protein [Acetobacteraceae bacterium]